MGRKNPYEGCDKKRTIRCRLDVRSGERQSGHRRKGSTEERERTKSSSGQKEEETEGGVSVLSHLQIGAGHLVDGGVGPGKGKRAWPAIGGGNNSPKIRGKKEGEEPSTTQKSWLVNNVT